MFYFDYMGNFGKWGRVCFRSFWRPNCLSVFMSNYIPKSQTAICHRVSFGIKSWYRSRGEVIGMSIRIINEDCAACAVSLCSFTLPTLRRAERERALEIGGK